MPRHVRGSGVGVAADGGTNFVSFSCVFAMSFPDLMRGTADVTCMNVSDFYRRFIKGFKDSGEASFKIRFDPGAYAILKNIYEDNNCLVFPRWQFTFGNCPGDDTAFFRFFGIITKLGMPEKSIDGENVWECDCSVKISGNTAFYVNNVAAA